MQETKQLNAHVMQILENDFDLKPGMTTEEVEAAFKKHCHQGVAKNGVFIDMKGNRRIRIWTKNSGTEYTAAGIRKAMDDWWQDIPL